MYKIYLKINENCGDILIFEDNVGDDDDDGDDGDDDDIFKGKNGGYFLTL